MAKYFAIQPAFKSFLGNSPVWYKKTIITFLAINPLLLFGLELLGMAPETAGFIVGWLLVLQFIFTLAMALYCYPLQPGGLLALQGVLLGLTSAQAVYSEIHANLPVFLLLMYMVAGILFMRELLLEAFSRILLGIRNDTLMNVTLLLTSAVLSAFLDALTVIAVLITVSMGIASAYKLEEHKDRLNTYMAGLVMNGAIGTALGGVCTLVGEPQNLLIAGMAGWEFTEFFWRMAPVTMPCLLAGALTCWALQRFGWFGYGGSLGDEIKQEIVANLAADRPTDEHELDLYRTRLVIQAICGLLLVAALMFHLAEVGLIGLALLVLGTAFTGVVEEHKLGPAFSEAMPFVALLGCFFAVVAAIHDQHLFAPVSAWVQSFPTSEQPAILFLATGLLSAISDNVFVATVYMTEIQYALKGNLMDREHFDLLAVAINTGTNLPSIATPNGQAAFLFLLTSSVAPLINLSYLRMVYMALPYTLVLTVTGLLCVIFLL